jgi:RHS repeat-associated protein
MTHTRRLTTVALFLFLAPLAAAAQPHPNQSRGLTGGTFQPGSIDSVSLFNGALSLAIPLGQSYPGGGTFSYRLMLSYNSNIWDYETVFDGGQFYTEAEPHEQFNSGIGWMLTLGALLPPFSAENPTDRWMYLTPDGGQHSFYQSQHEGENDGDTNYLYTRDGTYLRMQKVSNTDRRITYPDGTLHKFLKSGGLWRLTRIEDGFGNYLALAYSTDPVSGEETWTLTDRHGRTHYVRLAPVVWLNWAVQEVDLETVGGSRLVYTFDYVTQLVNRSCKDDYPNNSDRISLPHLVRINLPDGSFFSMQDANGPRYVNVCEEGIEDVPGILRGIQLPTGGQIAYEFQEVDFPPGGQQNTFDSAAGVEKRHLQDSQGTTLGTWTYKTTMVPQNGSDDPEMQMEVIAPTGDCSKHYFAGQYWLNVTGPDPYSGWEYGMPFVWRESSGGSYLSSETWSGSTGTSCSGTKLRSTYLRFEHDKLPGSAGEEVKHRWFASNRRVAATRTVFHDDGERFVDTQMSDFDGLGHYRGVATSGNLGAALPGGGASESRTTHTEFNPAYGTYAYDPTTNAPCCGHDFVPVPTTADWLLGTFTYTEAADPGATGSTVARSEFAFDANGRLRTSRVLSTGTSRSANDLLTAYTTDTEGNVESLRLYGGDTQALSTASGWTLPADYLYRTDFTYAYGALETARNYAPSGTPMSWLAYDADLDPSTGLAVARRTPAGFSTSFAYDAVGRLVTATPQAGAPTVYIYTVPGPGVPGAVKVKVGSFVSAYAESETVFDEFGRLWKERLDTPNHGWVERETLYNVRDWVLSRSELGFSANKTEYQLFDAFGRPQRIRPPDGSSHDLLLTYFGSRGVRLQAKVATAQGAETYVSRERYVDSFGRLLRVLEPSAPGGEMVSTTYRYDAAGRLTEIATDDPSSVYDQVRRFTYDNRGFLLSEQHPEKGAAGNGWVTYSVYDPKGKVGRVVDGPNTLDYVYDTVGRTLRVEDVNQADRPVLEYQYDGGTGYGAARLWKAIRHNYVDLPWTPASEEDVTVTETYGYSGVGGRTSDRLTEIAPLGYSFAQTFGYDQAGQLATLGYPDCQHAACPPAEPARTVGYTYDLGFLTAVPGWASSISYHANGLWDQVTHASGILDQQQRDPFGIARPSRLQTVGAVGGAEFDTGLYAFDGAGNVKAMGAETFLYDAVSRVKEGTSEGQTQRYDYDIYGNINSVTTVFEGGGQATYTTPTDPTTNRLQGATYDAAGSLTAWGSYGWSYDATNHTRSATYPGGEKVFLYTADGERIWTIDEAATLSESVTLRSLGGKVLRRYSISGRGGTEAWAWEQDYVYRGGALLASELPTGQRHFHRDHLGNTRLLTDASKAVLDRYAYFPYGAQRSQSGSVAEAMRFTGHERDANGAGSAGIQDYMHARYYSPHLGRFARVDPLRGRSSAPQSLNRYAYATGNPLLWVDLTGLDPEPPANEPPGFSDYECVTAFGDACGSYWMGFYNFGADPLEVWLVEFLAGVGPNFEPSAPDPTPNPNPQPPECPPGSRCAPPGFGPPDDEHGNGDGNGENGDGHDQGEDGQQEEQHQEPEESGASWPPDWSCGTWVAVDAVAAYAIYTTTVGMVGACGVGPEAAGTLGLSFCVVEAQVWSTEVGIVAPFLISATAEACGF